MKSAFAFILVCGVVAVVHGQGGDNSWGFKPQGPNRPGRPQVNPAPAPVQPPAPVGPQIDGNGQLIGCPCRTTQENNLVCGTDGNTYGNMGKLRCAQKCKEVQLAHLGSCSARDPLETITG